MIIKWGDVHVEIDCGDGHVHWRDEEQANKATIKDASDLFVSQGFKFVMDMAANCRPPVLSRKRAMERLELANRTKNPLIDYYLYAGLTADLNQIAEVVKLAQTERQVCGLKLFAGGSLANIGVLLDIYKQWEIYQGLARFDYRKVLAVHCEKEPLFQPKLWDPQAPWTHSLAQPPESEIESVRDQIYYALQSGFKGILHICHVSCPESVELIDKARNYLKITCGVTPHHILWTDEKLRRKDGLLYKVNPPLRDLRRVEKLRQYLIDGKITWIETDFAPHTKEDKFERYCSGIANLSLYGKLLNWLHKEGGLSWPDIEKLTYHNIVRTFGLK